MVDSRAHPLTHSHRVPPSLGGLPGSGADLREGRISLSLLFFGIL